jgi:hypothetical protein
MTFSCNCKEVSEWFWKLGKMYEILLRYVETHPLWPRKRLTALQNHPHVRTDSQRKIIRHFDNVNTVEYAPTHTSLYHKVKCQSSAPIKLQAHEFVCTLNITSKPLTPSKRVYHAVRKLTANTKPECKLTRSQNERFEVLTAASIR